MPGTMREPGAFMPSVGGDSSSRRKSTRSPDPRRLSQARHSVIAETPPPPRVRDRIATESPPPPAAAPRHQSSPQTLHKRNSLRKSPPQQQQKRTSFHAAPAVSALKNVSITSAGRERSPSVRDDRTIEPPRPPPPVESSPPQPVIEERERHKATLNNSHGTLRHKLHKKQAPTPSESPAHSSTSSQKAAPSPEHRKSKQEGSSSVRTTEDSGYASNQGERSSDVDMMEHTPISERSEDGPPVPAINPLDIVNMALSLNESRRRNISLGQVMPGGGPGVGRRVTSAGFPQPATGLQGSYHNYENPGLQRASGIASGSRSMTPSSADRRPVSHTPDRFSTPNRAVSVSTRPKSEALLEPEYQFSDGTLARAEKARKYFELAAEHRRLLEFLPPLKQDSGAPGNIKVSTASVPGTPNIEFFRIPTYTGNQHPLGRPYNPLQQIRNRKTRARERKTLDPDIDAWDNVDKVRFWVDAVGDRAQRPQFRGADHVILPPFWSDDPFVAGGNASHPLSKNKRPRMDWVSDPREGLADTYWLEQDDHRGRIEDHHGNKIFPEFSRITRPKTADSNEIEAVRSAENASNAGDTASTASMPIAPGSDVESERHGRRRRRILPLARDAGLSKLKRGSLAMRSPSHSDSDIDMSEDEGKRRRARRHPGDDENVGPLERHMANMIAAQSDANPPITPATPEKWGTSMQDERRPTNSSYDSSEMVDTMTHRNSSVISRSRVPSGDTPDTSSVRESRASEDRSRLSIDRLGISSPARESAKENMFESTKSPHKHRSLHKALLHRGSVKDKHKIEITDFAVYNEAPADGSRNSPGSSLGRNERSPDKKHGFLHHRKNQSVNTVSSASPSRSVSSDQPDTDGRGEKKDHHRLSKVLKPGRIGELLHVEGSKSSRSRSKESAKLNDAHSNPSDINTSAENTDNEDFQSIDGSLRKQAPNLSRTSTMNDDDDRLPRGRGREQRYYTKNLPSFKSPFSPPPDLSVPAITTTSPVDDHITQQARERARDRSPRLVELAPPRLNVRSSSVSLAEDRLGELKTIESHDSDPPRRQSESLSRSRSRARNDNEGPGKLPGVSGSVRSALPQTGLAALESKGDRRASSYDELRTGREWSLFNTPGPRQETFDRREIARVRALFLASGIKARGINLRATRPFEELPLFLTSAAKLANKELVAIPRAQSHVLAARILSTYLQDTSHAMDVNLITFRSRTTPELLETFNDLRRRIEQSITPSVQGSADQADAFTGELTGKHKLAVKHVNDNIDAMYRRRRRQFRWLRGLGFGFLEWVMLGILWGIWIVVYAIRALRATLWLVIAGVRWLLFL